MKFFIKDFFSKCDQTRSYLRIWSHLLKKWLMENLIFCAVYTVMEVSYYETLYFAICLNMAMFGHICRNMAIFIQRVVPYSLKIQRAYLGFCQTSMMDFLRKQLTTYNCQYTKNEVFH